LAVSEALRLLAYHSDFASTARPSSESDHEIEDNISENGDFMDIDTILAREQSQEVLLSIAPLAI